MHAIKSIVQPWALGFCETYENIAAEAEQVKRLADVATKVELRHTREEVVQGNKILELMQGEIAALRKENQQLQAIMVMKIVDMQESITRE